MPPRAYVYQKKGFSVSSEPVEPNSTLNTYCSSPPGITYNKPLNVASEPVTSLIVALNEYILLTDIALSVTACFSFVNKSDDVNIPVRSTLLGIGVIALLIDGDCVIVTYSPLSLRYLVPSPSVLIIPTLFAISL